MTGGSAAFGAQLKQGVEQAVEDINAAGGILGQKIVLYVGDDRADPKEGVSVANKFAADGVKFVIGHFNSGVTIPGSDVYKENGMLVITPAATNPKVTERGMWNMFRVCGRDDQQGSVAGAIIAEQVQGQARRHHPRQDHLRPGPRRRDPQGDERQGRQGGDLRGRQQGRQGLHRAGLQDQGAPIPTSIYWGGLHDTGGLIVRQMRDQGVKAPLMGGDGMADDEFAAIAGPGAEGTLMTFSPDPRTNPKNKDDRRAVPQEARLRAAGLHALQLRRAADHQAGGRAGEVARPQEGRRGHAFRQGVRHRAGRLSFDKKGDITGYIVAGKTKDRYVLYTWKKGPDGKLTLFREHQ